MSTLVIIGGGIAGTTVAEEVRKGDPERRIVVLDAEDYPLYSRVLLPHYVKGKVVREKVFLRTEDWYREQRIERVAAIATAIDREHCVVVTDDGQEFHYGDLVITTGSTPRRAPDEMEGVSYLATVDDADHLVGLLRQYGGPEGAQLAVVYGGGFIACEFVNIFAHHQMPTTLFMRGDGFWNTILTTEAQQLVESFLVKGGVTVRTGESFPALIGSATLEAVQSDDGMRVPCAILGVGIGSPPDVSLAESAGLATYDGILCDEFLETNDPRIYVAGDVAARHSPVFGRSVRFANWQAALSHGRALGKTLLGLAASPSAIPSYSTNILGHHIVFIGDVAKDAAEEIRTITSDGARAEHWYIRNGSLVGAVIIGDITKRAELTAKIGERV